MIREKKERNQQIIQDILKGDYQVDIARKFNVSPAVISKIKKRYGQQSSNNDTGR